MIRQYGTFTVVRRLFTGDDMHTYVERVGGEPAHPTRGQQRRVDGYAVHAFSIRLHTDTVHATPHGAACTCIA